MHDAAAEGNRIIMIPVIARKDSQTERNNESGEKRMRYHSPSGNLAFKDCMMLFPRLKELGWMKSNKMCPVNMSEMYLASLYLGTFSSCLVVIQGGQR